MSLTYSADVQNTKIWTFIKILLKWKGSLIKWIWLETLVFILLYEFIAITFHYIITKKRFPLGNMIFTSVIELFQLSYNMITVAFVLGFYVSMVVSRWFVQQNFIPWTDDIAILVSAFINGNTEHDVHMRRTIMRYLNAGYLVAARELFEDIKKQFPDEKQIIKAGFLNESELEKINNIDTSFSKYFIPITWALKLICQARDESLIKSDRMFDKLVDRVADFRGQIGGLWLIDTVNPPLCYAQFAGISVYGFVIAALLAYQKIEFHIDNESSFFKIFIVTFPPLEIFIFVFYIGWYKIGETLTNPYGQTEYNFDIIYSLQHNLQMAFLIVDQLHDISPPLLEEPLVQQIETVNVHNLSRINPIFNSMLDIEEIESMLTKAEPEQSE